MAINRETLKAARLRLGWSQQELADATRSIKGGAVSKRQIARIESGRTPAEGVRRRTLESLAKALKITVEELTRGSHQGPLPDSWQWEVGYRPMLIKAVVLPETPLNYELVMHHYGVSKDDLVDAAPWMFTLLAELSLAERRRRVEATESVYEETTSDHVRWLIGDAFAEAHHFERNSISERDVFGKQLPLEFDITNPFVEEIKGMARKAGSDAIDPDSCVSFPEARTSWAVFEGWFTKLTGGDVWARHAIDYEFVRIDEIPEELQADDRTPERAAWLAAKVPAEHRARVQREDDERRRRFNESAAIVKAFRESQGDSDEA